MWSLLVGATNAASQHDKRWITQHQICDCLTITWQIAQHTASNTNRAALKLSANTNTWDCNSHLFCFTQRADKTDLCLRCPPPAVACWFHKSEIRPVSKAVLHLLFILLFDLGCKWLDRNEPSTIFMHLPILLSLWTHQKGWRDLKKSHCQRSRLLAAEEHAHTVYVCVVQPWWERESRGF